MNVSFGLNPEVPCLQLAFEVGTIEIRQDIECVAILRIFLNIRTHIVYIEVKCQLL